MCEKLYAIDGSEIKRILGTQLLNKSPNDWTISKYGLKIISAKTYIFTITISIDTLLRTLLLRKR